MLRDVLHAISGLQADHHCPSMNTSCWIANSGHHRTVHDSFNTRWHRVNTSNQDLASSFTDDLECSQCHIIVVEEGPGNIFVANKVVFPELHRFVGIPI